MDNVGFIAAAYLITAAVLIGYTLLLLRRLARARKRRDAVDGER